MATMAERMGWPFAEFVNAIAVEAERQARSAKRPATLRSQKC
jgi:electron transfer flavoprotein alpha/beta subunit